ncbi:hypothetical protein EYF80_037900 [Liparis tanakae]|uniref:Uncharacterized protein n=1 Tax=Liparis tanakae TaxID=230148 RepID=A0A4Z2GGL3_9TELE|nr:hypothetical protein EYF80_037900 [Liparis tanakae]
MASPRYMEPVPHVELIDLAEELFLLPGDKINPSIFQQCSKYKEQTHSHPDVNGFHVRDLQEETGEALEPELWVVMVSTVVMPSATLAGAASILIQKDTQERMTMRREGMYIWIRTDLNLSYGPTRTVPFLKIRSSLLSVVTSWKLAPFSLAKKRSGFQMESNMDGSRSREESGYLLYASRGSFHFCRRKIFTL